MDKTKILLICGGGASSGFMAANIRRAVIKRGLPFEVDARSESEIDQLLPEIDCLMLAPHLKYLYEDLQQRCKVNKVKVAVMSPTYYGIIDGERALDHIVYVLKKED